MAPDCSMELITCDRQPGKMHKQARKPQTHGPTPTQASCPWHLPAAWSSSRSGRMWLPAWQKTRAGPLRGCWRCTPSRLRRMTVQQCHPNRSVSGSSRTAKNGVLQYNSLVQWLGWHSCRGLALPHWQRMTVHCTAGSGHWQWTLHCSAVHSWQLCHLNRFVSQGGRMGDSAIQTSMSVSAC